jgi:hypothetical protein
VATGPGSASARAMTSTLAMAHRSAMAAIAPPKLAKVAQVSESAAAAETVTAPP